MFQLETLAGSADPGTLLRTLENGYEHTIADVTQHMLDMTSNSVAQRSNAAGQMHWNPRGIALLSQSVPHSGNYDIVTDPMSVYWTASALLSRDQIIQRFAQKIQNNRLAILNMLRNAPLNG